MARPDHRPFFCRLTPSTHRALRIRAAEEDRTMAQVVESAIKAYIRAPGRAAAKLGKKAS